MDKTTRSLLVISVALEAVGWCMQIAGVEVQWLGWILIGIGGVTLVIMICRLFSNKEKPKQTPASEINK